MLVQGEAEHARFARAVPLAAITAAGLGPLQVSKGETWEERLRRFAASDTALVVAVDSAGSVGRMLLALVGLCGGSLTDDRLLAETSALDPVDVKDAVTRLCDARLLFHRDDGRFALTAEVAERWQPETVSLADQHAMKSDALTFICRRLELKPRSNKKADKISAIADLFDGPDRHVVRGMLSPEASKLLDRIAELGGVQPLPVEEIGLSTHGLHRVEAPAYAAFVDRMPEDPSLAALQELSRLGIVGVSDYDRTVWIWHEAWSLLDRPFYSVWSQPPQAGIVERPPVGASIPALVGIFDEALRYWLGNPPAALKNNEPRLAKATVRSMAKSLGTTEPTIELVSRLAMTMELILPNLVGRSGRGRNARAEYRWMVDPDAAESWSVLSPLRKWLNLLGYWSRQSATWDDQLLANRLLVLWELSSLAPGTAFEKASALAARVDHLYQPVGVEGTCLDALVDLRILEVVTDDPTALTELGRLAISGFDQVEALQLEGTSHATVQADLTVIAPPDLNADLSFRLRSIAEVESSAGATIYRLSETAVASAVQGGESVESIVGFLAELSPVPIDDVVRRFVTDAALTADKIKILDAPSVLVTTDPAELTTAIRLKSAKLTPVTSTVATSVLPPDKLRTILAKKGLTPAVVPGPSGHPAPRSAKEGAARLEQRAEQYRSMAKRHNNKRLAEQAGLLADQAAAARDPSGRWQRHRSFAVGPDTIGSVGSS